MQDVQQQEQQALQAQQPMSQRRHLSTKLLHPPHSTDDPYEAVSPPLYQTATFGQPSATTNGPYDYTRSGNPTRTQLETQMADLEVIVTERDFPGGSLKKGGSGITHVPCK